MRVEIIPATPQQAHIAVEILLEAVHWLNARGEPLWQPDELPLEKFVAAAEQGELFLAYLEGEPVGTLTLRWEDEPYWPEIKRGESAFFHKVAVRRKVAGQGVARAMIEWAIEQAQAAGVSHLRMDTDFARPKLRAFYEDLGFQYVGEKITERYHLVLYELALGK